MNKTFDPKAQDLIEVTAQTMPLGCPFRVAVSWDSGRLLLGDDVTEGWNLRRLVRAVVTAVGRNPQPGQSSEFLLDAYEVIPFAEDSETLAEIAGSVPLLNANRMRAIVVDDGQGRPAIVVEFIERIAAR
ncbi:MAG: hypothetical protein K1X74_06190 [Pirellulales bacterium]|nr:hypothetical protein [Pirellulales bacterium]